MGRDANELLDQLAELIAAKLQTKQKPNGSTSPRLVSVEDGSLQLNSQATLMTTSTSTGQAPAQQTVPLVVRTANGGGLGFGAQHSQAVENWTLAIPGLKIAAPSNPADVVGLMASAVRSEDPVVFFEHKGLMAGKGPAAPEGHVVPLGQAAIARPGTDITIVALAATVPMALAAADRLAADGVSAEVVDLRCLVPLDMATVLASVDKTSRLLIVEENPYQGGWGGTVASIVADEGFELLDAPVKRIAAACVPLPFADVLEQQVIPTVDSVTTAIRGLLAY